MLAPHHPDCLATVWEDVTSPKMREGWDDAMHQREAVEGQWLALAKPQEWCGMTVCYQLASELLETDNNSRFHVPWLL